MVLFPLPAPQVSHKESEEALQKRLDEVSRELCRSQTSHASLRADAEKAQEQQQQLAGEAEARLRGSRRGGRVCAEARSHEWWADGAATATLVCCGAPPGAMPVAEPVHS